MKLKCKLKKVKKPKKMPIRPVDTRNKDIKLVLSRLRATVFPPNENEETITRLINGPVGRDFIFVDDVEGTLCRLFAHDPLGPRPKCVVVWWLWDGIGSPTRLRGVLQEALESFVAFYPKSRTWPIYGDLPTEAEALAMQAMFGGSDTVDVAPSPANPTHYTRASSTVGQILTHLQGA